MRNVRVELAAAALSVCFGASLALGCIFEFPWQLLNNRAVTLDTMPVHNSFIFAAAHLVPPPKDALHAVEPGTASANEEEPSDAEPVDPLTKAEDAGLSSDQAEMLQQMRAETSGDSAFDKGALLPASVRLYTAGAVDFHKGDTTKAIARFQEILDLPPDDRRDREVWAAYMLGRLYGRKGEVDKASRSFALTRNFVDEGAPDPLGLAVASYGEEARVHLDRARALQKSKKMSATQHKDYGQEIAAAVGLYAEQAAHGSSGAIDSLHIVAYEVLGDKAAVEASICDPIVRQLLVDRLLTDYASAPDSYSGYSDETPKSQLAQVVSATQKCGEEHLANADQLAAIAYRSGDYRLAQRVVAQATGPLASWVRARLAMQQGNNAEAARYYAEASKAFPASIDPHSADAGTKALLVGQNSALTLSRGEYIDALEQLYPYAATFWGDVAYIGERVLTVDELKTFVDAHNDTRAQPEISLANLPEPVGSYATDYGSNDVPNPFGFADRRGPTAHLSDLLARRLVRAGRYQEALKYFPPRAAGTSAPWDYAQALADASTDKSKIDRARAWYGAATLAGDFKSGNQLMGTEGRPDYYVQPAIQGGTGPWALSATDRFITEGERQRFKDSAPKPDFRYHYLFVGVDAALHAADLLPPRSQAFAAVLCHATRFVIDGKLCPASAPSLRDSTTAYASETPSIVDPLTLDTVWLDESYARINLTCQLYQRYLKEGAVVPWATRFGRLCPDPDFDSAAGFVQAQIIREARRRTQTTHHRWTVLFKLALIALCLGASTWWFFRHRYA